MKLIAGKVDASSLGTHCAEVQQMCQKRCIYIERDPQKRPTKAPVGRQIIVSGSSPQKGLSELKKSRKTDPATHHNADPATHHNADPATHHNADPATHHKT